MPESSNQIPSSDAGDLPQELPIQAVERNAQNELVAAIATLFPKYVDEWGVEFSEPLEIRQKIQDLETMLINLPAGKIFIKTTHTFLGGMYAREVFIPKGAIIVGKIHRRGCFVVVSKGEVISLTETGAKKITAPFAVVSPAGSKRVLLALEDTVWTTMHKVNSRDLAKVEEELVTESFDAVDLSDQDFVQLVTMEGK